MGIDFPNVWQVIHWDMPMTLNPKYELQAELVGMVCVFLKKFFRKSD